jgi:glycyl-tRNA synthetase beta chain
VELEAPPTKEQLGAAALTWAAVSLADKLDTVVGMFAAGERPKGSRDPYGLRRASQGIVKVLADLPVLIGRDATVSLEELVERTLQNLNHTVGADQREPLFSFFAERIQHLMQVRGMGYEEIQAATGDTPALMKRTVADTVERGAVFREQKATQDFIDVAAAYKRANNIVDIERPAQASSEADWNLRRELLAEPAELALRRALDDKGPAIRQAVGRRDYRRAISEIASLKNDIYTFFDKVLVNVEDNSALREARLSLLTEFRDRVRELGDISALIPAASKAAKQ